MKEVVVVDPHTVRFVLHEPWPDFMTIYGTLASAAGWIMPKNYIEKVGPDGFKKHPIGLGPYKFVSHEAWHRTGDGGERELLAQGAVGKTHRVPERAGGDDAPRDAETRRGRSSPICSKASSASRSRTTRS